MKTTKSISVVIPAYNEEKTVKNVLDVALESHLFSEIICVDDASTDHTYDVLKSFGTKIKLIHFAENKGKGAALSAGIKMVSTELVMFMDADLINLTTLHIKEMYDTMVSGGYDVVLGSKSGYSNFIFFIMSFIILGRSGQYGKNIDEFSGERIYYRKDLLPQLKVLDGFRYEIEPYLNKLFKDKKIGFVSLKNLRHLAKHQKRGFNYKMLKESIYQIKSMARGDSI